MKERKTIFEELKGANEKRFDGFAYNPRFLSRHQNSDVPDFNRYAKRNLLNQSLTI